MGRMNTIAMLIDEGLSDSEISDTMSISLDVIKLVTKNIRSEEE